MKELHLPVWRASRAALAAKSWIAGCQQELIGTGVNAGTASVK